MSDQVRYALRDTLKAAVAKKELPEQLNLDDAAQVLEDLVFANLRRAFQASDDQGSFDMPMLAERISFQVSTVVAGLKA